MNRPGDPSARSTQPISIGQAGSSRPPGAGQQAPPPPPAGPIAARMLSSSVLPEPIRLEDGKVYRIGRDRACDICFPSTHVSRTHAEIALEKGGWVVGDLGSRNGTQVNGEKVLRRPLRHGDRIQMGAFEVQYQELTAQELADQSGKKKDTNTDTLKLNQDEVGFFGDVKRLSVVEVVQLLGQNRKTGFLTIVEEKAPERKLALVDGAIVHAEFGNQDGERAVPAILRARAGRFAFRPAPEAASKVTIQTPTPMLLLAAMEAMKG